MIAHTSQNYVANFSHQIAVSAYTSAIHRDKIACALQTESRIDAINTFSHLQFSHQTLRVVRIETETTVET
jgi:hypothetical protein